MAEEQPATFYSTPHLVILKGTGFAKEGNIFLNRLRSAGISNFSYFDADDVLHNEVNRNEESYVLALRERSYSALKRGNHSIIAGAINKAKNNHGPSVIEFLVGDAVNESKKPAIIFCFDESKQNFLKRQRERIALNGWPYGDSDINEWHKSTRPCEGETIIPVTSLEETINKLWSYIPLI